MAIVVQKYGGSSVSDVQKLRRVAERIMRTRQQGHDLVVVVSAMGDTTDDLLRLAKQVSPNPDRRELDMLLSAGEVYRPDERPPVNGIAHYGTPPAADAPLTQLECNPS